MPKDIEICHLLIFKKNYLSLIILIYDFFFFFECVERSEKRELLHIHSQICDRNI